MKQHSMQRIVTLVFCLWMVIGFSLVNVDIATADSLDQLKNQLDQLQKKIQELEGQQADNSKKLEEIKAEAVTAGKKPGTWKLPGSNTEVSIGGYLKLDAIYSDKSTGVNSDFDQFLVPGTIPLDNADDYEDNQMVMHARQSRLVVQTNTPTDWGNLKAYLEGDFFGGNTGNQAVSNSYVFRLRHAYGRLGNLMAGQYWSTFMLVETSAETLDFGGPVGSTFVRQAQLRWIQPFKWGSLQFALENPETTVLDNDGTTLKPDDDSFPDTIVRATFNTSLGRFDVAGMARNLRIDQAGREDDLWTGAVTVGAIIPTIGKETITFEGNYGNGLGRYIAGNFQDAMINPDNGELESLTIWGGYIHYRHFWADNLRSTLAYSYITADNDTDYVPDTVNKTFQSVHANLIYSPVPQVDVGLEYIWAQRELENDEDADLNRVQASVTYRFF
jgi:hypothetical protein